MIDLSEKRMIGPAIRLHSRDNVLIARVDLAIGTPIPSENITSRSQVAAGNKIAARAIARGEAIRKYDVVIGFAAADIPAGTMIHNHNMAFREFDRDYAHARDFRPVELLPEAERATFQGIVRADGSVATRNFIGVLATVNCSATVVHKIAEWFTPERLAEYPNVDGVIALAHGTGLAPNIDPRPVVNAIRFAPPATWPVADTGSKPGVSMNTRPDWVTGSAYL